MPVRIVVGGNWGDEGKGRMVDYFAHHADFVVRYQGGNNAGHTIVNEHGRFILRLMPSGIFYPSVINVLGPGAVINLEGLAKEMAELSAKGIDVSPRNVKVSERASICFPFHGLQDRYEEERLGKAMFGSTLQGIAPVYGDRYLKYGIQVGALRDPDFLREQIARCLELKNLIFERVYQKPAVSVDEMCDWALQHAKTLLPHVCDTTTLLTHAVKAGKTVLMEAQLGALRDVFFGIYPFTTSSNPISNFAYVGGGLFTDETPGVTAVIKAFSTCVGEGPFVTEIHGEEADRFRTRTGEFGAVTGRPRRVGPFDAVASRYGVRVQNASDVALTKLDNLSGEERLRICTHYSINGKQVDDFPLFPELRVAQPVYIDMPGWKEDLQAVRKYSDLPLAARNYVEKIEELIGVKIKFVSVGPQRDALMLR
ncbi:MAG TPA: adenylosuccinate synthase [Candidatus Angelobacter sp.]|nr:adenylosuccinate synthase [Candidatus Angelobacter sp.]